MFPRLFITPAVTALTAAILTAIVPTHAVVRDRAVVAQASFGHVVWVAVAGILGGLAFVFVGLMAWAALVYERHGDPDWEITWNLAKDPQGAASQVLLRSKSKPLVHTSALGDVDAYLLQPDGHIYRKEGWTSGSGGPTIAVYDHGSTFQAVKLAIDDERFPLLDGVYEIRWYGRDAKRRLYEIARGNHRV